MIKLIKNIIRFIFLRKSDEAKMIKTMDANSKKVEHPDPTLRTEYPEFPTDPEEIDEYYEMSSKQDCSDPNWTEKHKFSLKPYGLKRGSIVRIKETGEKGIADYATDNGNIFVDFADHSGTFPLSDLKIIKK